ncbi:MAG: hypothetical protein ACJAV0_000522 [Shewanella sp.]|jgi:hypothetical protein
MAHLKTTMITKVAIAQLLMVHKHYLIMLQSAYIVVVTAVCCPFSARDFYETTVRLFTTGHFFCRLQIL